MNVQWKAIPGYEGLYAVSNIGRVKRLQGYKCKTEKILLPRMKNSGYFFVTLSKSNQKRNFYVHHLVAELFIGKRPEGMDVNHINGVKQHNIVSNLEYVTRAGNMAHARATGLHNNYADGHYNAKLSSELVLEIRRANDLVGVDVKDVALTLGVSERTVKDVLENRTWRSVHE